MIAPAEIVPRLPNRPEYTRQGGNRGLGDDVVDDNVVETGFGAQFGDGSLDFVGDCIESAAVVGGDGEGDHGGAAENSGCRMGW